jgi:DNA-binding protein YbaB
MSTPMRDELERAMEQVRAQQSAAGELRRRLADLSTTMTSTDRMVTVTVDAAGVLNELTLSGSRYKHLAPADLCNRVVQAVRAAQDQASATTAELMSGNAPAALVPGIDELRDGDIHFADMLAEARKRLDSLMFHVADEPRESSDEQ